MTGGLTIKNFLIVQIEESPEVRQRGSERSRMNRGTGWVLVGADKDSLMERGDI